MLYGNVKRQHLGGIVNGQKIEEVVKTSFTRPLMIDQCRECNWGKFCGAGCMGNALESSGTIRNADSCNVGR
ncbi:hypothetical protein DRO03_07520 [Methanosarcinales archaeon]|nr:MAG: hypothetical protein DRO03_07520 [Methanosarcinales archaeon]